MNKNEPTPFFCPNMPHFWSFHHPPLTLSKSEMKIYEKYFAAEIFCIEINENLQALKMNNFSFVTFENFLQ
jgi:hypothetical protein